MIIRRFIKYMRYLFITLAALLCWMLPACADESLPPAVADALSPAAVISSACWEDEGDVTWFVLTQDSVYTLHCFSVSDGGCTENFHTDGAVPQDCGQVRLIITDGVRSFVDGESWLPGPILLILQYDMDGRSVWQRIAFRREDGVWRLHSLLDSASGLNLSITDGTAIWRVPADKGQMAISSSIPCTFDTDLRTRRLTDVPLTIP